MNRVSCVVRRGAYCVALLCFFFLFCPTGLLSRFALLFFFSFMFAVGSSVYVASTAAFHRGGEGIILPFTWKLRCTEVVFAWFELQGVRVRGVVATLSFLYGYHGITMIQRRFKEGSWERRFSVEIWYQPRRKRGKKNVGFPVGGGISEAHVWPKPSRIACTAFGTGRRRRQKKENDIRDAR